MHRIFDALCRLLAPILVFTAKESWGYLHGDESVHVASFPDCRAGAPPAAATDAVALQVEHLLKLRSVIGQAVEKARQEKRIGNALEASVTLTCDEKTIADIPKEELEEFFILSDLTLQPGKEPAASISKTPYQKCARCWRHRPSVGKSAAHPDLCDRCEGVVAKR